MIFILVSTLMFHEQPIPDHSYIKAKLTDFYKIGNLHISGKTKTGVDVENEITKFNYYKNGFKLKLIQTTNTGESSRYSDEKGFYTTYNNKKDDLGKIFNGYGFLYNNANLPIAIKQSESLPALMPLSGSFAQTIVNRSDNPCYSISELLSMSDMVVKEGSLNSKKVYVVELRSTWGLVTIWLDATLYAPLKAESYIVPSCLMATGKTLTQAQKENSYKTIAMRNIFIYEYEGSNNNKKFPSKIFQRTIENGIANETESVLIDFFTTIEYFIFEPLTNSMQNNFTISSTAKNGTPFTISNQPQIAYHLENGQLVLSANHQLLNKISHTVFGGPGFWQRLLVILIPSLLSAGLGYFLWRRWKPKTL